MVVYPINHLFQNHGEHEVELYIHDMNVGHFTPVNCKEEDVSAQKEVRREDIFFQHACH
jgi:hypothetical protein